MESMHGRSDCRTYAQTPDFSISLYYRLPYLLPWVLAFCFISDGRLILTVSDHFVRSEKRLYSDLSPFLLRKDIL